MKLTKKILAFILVAVCMFTFCLTASAADYTDSANDAATNWTTGDDEIKMVYARPMYDELGMVTAADIGIENFGELYDIFTKDSKIYLLDTKNGIVTITDENLTLIKQISSLSIDGVTSDFIGARGIFVDDEGRIYICDTSHNRVVLCNEEGVAERVITKPDSELWPEDLHYNPIKIVVDEMDYVYILCDGSYYGAAMYTPEYTFKGFFGANTVSSTLLEALNKFWDILFNNNIKLSKSEKKLPYSFVDIVIGPDGFLYTCTGNLKAGSGTAQGAIKRLNPIGTNILKDKSGTAVKDASNALFATTKTAEVGGKKVYHDISSISIDENNYIYALDVRYGRAYIYDLECNLLCTIGGGIGSGNQTGTFKSAKAIETMGDKVYIIDNIKNTINIFRRNAYGTLVQQAQTLTIDGEYVEAGALWNEVLKQDTNNILAYRGIAKANFISQNYNEAMKYARLGSDRATYSRAYEYVRTDFLSRYFVWLTLAAVAIVAAAIYLLRLKRKKNFKFIRNKKMSIALSTLLHPAEAFYEIKRNNNGSVFIATVFLAVWYMFKIIGFSSGFIFNTGDINNSNAWYALAQTVGLVALFTTANWAVCVLFEGKGKFKDIYTVTCYSMLPMIIQAILYDILANFLTLSEGNILTVVNYFCIILAAIILVMGLITIHEYSFGKFIFTTIVTVLAMILIVFLIFLIFILVQQLWTFGETVFMEAFYR